MREIHDLNTNIATLKMFIELIEKDLSKEYNERLKSILKNIDTNLVGLKSKIKDKK